MEYVERKTSAEFKLRPPKKSLLAQLDIELTERCNNNCIHCCINLPASDDAARAMESTRDDIRDILNQAASLGALQVRFTGGEPLLRPDFEELYLFARRLGLMVRLFTNGRLISPGLADLLARVPPLLPIEITVYGMEEQSYEAVSRVKGSFEQFRQGIEMLLQRNVNFVVKSALLPPNRHEVEAFQAWAAGLPGMQERPTYAVSFEKRSRRDDREKDRLIEKLRISAEEGLAFVTRNPDLYRKDMAQFCRKFLGPPGDKLFGCGAGKGGCVDAYGRLQPCLTLRDPGLSYDLRTGSLQEALASFFPKAREMLAANPAYLQRCSRCFLKSLCEQCPAKSWNETGTLDTPVEHVCRFAHAQARWLGMIGPQERSWEIRDWRARIERVFRE